MDNAISIKNLYKSLSGKPIVLNMSLEIPRGSLYGILGPNGAGKSTTLKLITGRLKPTSGSISVLGKNPWKQRVSMFRDMGYLPQNPTAPQDLKVLGYLIYMCQLRGYSKKDASIETRNVLEQVGLDKLEGNTIGKLSGGEMQRLGFANALIGSPAILILDEPTASLDPEGRVYIMDLITEMSRNKAQTVIVSSHILPEIQRMTNHIAIMSEGKVLVSGSMLDLTHGIVDNEYEIETNKPKELFELLKAENYNVSMDEFIVRIDIEGISDNIFHLIPKICADNEMQLLSFRPVRDALENVFLNYVSTGTNRRQKR